MVKSENIVVDKQFLARAKASGARIEDADGNDITDDDEYLQEFVTANSDGKDDKSRLQKVVDSIGGVSDDTGTTEDDKAVSEFIANTDPHNPQVIKLKRLQAQSDKLNIETDRARAKQEAEQLSENQALRDENATPQQKLASNLNEKVATPVKSKVASGIAKVSSLPTVGSVGLLLGILIFLLFVVVNVDGKGMTRMKQLWYMVNGRAFLKHRVSPTKGSSDATGVAGANLPGVNNGSSTGQGNGTLPGPTNRTGTGKVDLNKFQADSSQLQRDLLIGNFNGDIVDQWGATSALFTLNQDVKSGAKPATLQTDLRALQTPLNKLNDPMYNSDYKNVYGDLGF